MSQSKLLDPNIEAYVIKTSDRDFAEIKNEDHTTIGILETGKRTSFYLLEPNRSIVIKSRPSYLLGGDYMLEDSDGKIIGLIKGKGLFGYSFDLKNKKGDIILKGQERKKKEEKYYEITGKNQNLVASFSMTETGGKKQRWFHHWWDQYVLHIHDRSFDRRTLLGFFTFVHLTLLFPEYIP